jgi:hypothetical protein
MRRCNNRGCAVILSSPAAKCLELGDKLCAFNVDEAFLAGLQEANILLQSEDNIFADANKHQGEDLSSIVTGFTPLGCADPQTLRLGGSAYTSSNAQMTLLTKWANAQTDKHGGTPSVHLIGQKGSNHVSLVVQYGKHGQSCSNSHPKSKTKHCQVEIRVLGLKPYASIEVSNEAEQLSFKPHKGSCTADSFGQNLVRPGAWTVRKAKAASKRGTVEMEKEWEAVALLVSNHWGSPTPCFFSLEKQRLAAANSGQAKPLYRHARRWWLG